MAFCPRRMVLILHDQGVKHFRIITAAKGLYEYPKMTLRKVWNMEPYVVHNKFIIIDQTFGRDSRYCLGGSWTI